MKNNSSSKTQSDKNNLGGSDLSQAAVFFNGYN